MRARVRAERESGDCCGDGVGMYECYYGAQSGLANGVGQRRTKLIDVDALSFSFFGDLDDQRSRSQPACPSVVMVAIFFSKILPASGNAATARVTLASLSRCSVG